MRSISIPAALVLVCSSALSGFAATLKVPSTLYPTIQSALTAAGTGDVVQVAGGVYFEDLVINNKTDLRVQPRAGESVVVDAGGIWPLTILGNSGNVVVRNLVLRNGVGGVWIGDSSSQIKLRGCRIENISGVGVHIATADRVTIKKCEILGVGSHGVGTSTSSSNVRITKTTISQVGGRGLYLLGTDHSAVENVIAGAQQVGIQLGNAANLAQSCLLSKNLVKDTSANGIDIYPPATNCSVMENKILRVGGIGIAIRLGSSGHVLFGNKVLRAAFDGIQCAGDSNKLVKNKVKRAGGEGIELASAEHSLLRRNKVSKSGGNGFQVAGTSKWNTLKQNRATASGGYDLDDSTSPGDNTYLDNDFSTIAP